MIHVDQFQPGDLAEIEPQAAQPAARGVPREMAWALLRAGPAFTARDGAGRIVLTAGFQILHAGHARCWCVLAAVDGFALAELTRRTRNVIEAMQADHCRRIDMEVETAFGPGHRWAKLLGFTRECTMRGYGPEGQDFDLYARVRGTING